MRRPAITVAAVLATAALLAAGCGDDDDDATTAAGDTTTTTAEPAAEPGAGAVTVAVAETTLGSILVDGEGRTLYLFTNDSDGTSACAGSCAENWPPLEAAGDVATGDGVDDALLGTTTRDDGTAQVTYASMPLYHFASDAAAGDTNGQGVGGVWYVVGPDGEAVMATTTSSAAAGTVRDY